MKTPQKTKIHRELTLGLASAVQALGFAMHHLDEFRDIEAHDNWEAEEVADLRNNIVGAALILDNVESQVIKLEKTLSVPRASVVKPSGKQSLETLNRSQHVYKPTQQPPK